MLSIPSAQNELQARPSAIQADGRLKHQALNDVDAASDSAAVRHVDSLPAAKRGTSSSQAKAQPRTQAQPPAPAEGSNSTRAVKGGTEGSSQLADAEGRTSGSHAAAEEEARKKERKKERRERKKKMREKREALERDDSGVGESPVANQKPGTSWQTGGAQFGRSMALMDKDSSFGSITAITEGDRLAGSEEDAYSDDELAEVWTDFQASLARAAAVSAAFPGGPTSPFVLSLDEAAGRGGRGGTRIDWTSVEAAGKAGMEWAKSVQEAWEKERRSWEDAKREWERERDAFMERERVREGEREAEREEWERRRGQAVERAEKELWEAQCKLEEARERERTTLAELQVKDER